MLWSAPGDINIATPLEQSMRWDIITLVESVNLISAKKSITLIGLNIFFFASTAGPRAKFKLVLDRVSKFE